MNCEPCRCRVSSERFGGIVRCDRPAESIIFRCVFCRCAVPSSTRQRSPGVRQPVSTVFSAAAEGSNHRGKAFAAALTTRALKRDETLPAPACCSGVFGRCRANRSSAAKRSAGGTWRRKMMVLCRDRSCRTWSLPPMAAALGSTASSAGNAKAANARRPVTGAFKNSCEKR